MRGSLVGIWKIFTRLSRFRAGVTDDCEILVVGAGFELVLWYKLKNAGFEDVRFVRRAAMWAVPGTGTAILGLPAT